MKTVILSISLFSLFPNLLSSQKIELAAPLPNYKNDFAKLLNSPDLDHKTAATVSKAFKSLNTESEECSSCNLWKGLQCSKLNTNPEDLFSAFTAFQLKTNAECDSQININIEKISKLVTSPKTSIPNIFQSVHILRKSKALGNIENRNNIIGNLAHVYMNSEKSLVDAALTMLAGIEAGGAKLSKFASLQNKVDLAGKIQKSAVQFDFNRLVLEKDNLEAASLAVRALVATNKALMKSIEPLVTGETIIQLANGFLLSEPKTDLEKAYVVQALSALNAEMTGLAKPVSVTRSINYPDLQLNMFDVFGNAVTSSRFSIKINGQIEDVDASGKLDMSLFGLSAGVYNYEIQVSGGSSAYAGSKTGETFRISVPSDNKIDLEKIALKIQKKVKKGQTPKSEEVSSRSVGLGDILGISFKISGLEPHQTMIRFSLDDLEGFVLLKSSGHGFYAAPVDIDELSTSVFKGKSGTWSIEAILGDVSSVSIVQNIGSFVLDLPADMENKANNHHFEPMKTINHIFPEPESRPPVGVSNIFFMLTLAPLGVLIISWGIIGFNLKMMSLSIWGLLFHISIGGIFGLYVCYWLGYFNMFLTIRYLSMIGGVLLVSGNKHLNNLAVARKGADGKDKRE